MTAFNYPILAPEGRAHLVIAVGCGIADMRYSISNTAEFGDLTAARESSTSKPKRK